jgi:hypothetical protein
LAKAEKKAGVDPLYAAPTAYRSSGGGAHGGAPGPDAAGVGAGPGMMVRRTLPPNGGGAPAATAGARVDPTPGALAATRSPASMYTVYTIVVTTSSAKHSGTTANIELEMVGGNGKSGRLKLDQKGNRRADLFETGSTDSFEFELPELGGLTQIVVRSDGKKGLFRSESKGEWCCESVRVSTPHGGICHFPMQMWFGKKHGMVLEHTVPLQRGSSSNA